jgi:alkylation response protein AidB-like acyl-CoA dehydrogenase
VTADVMPSHRSGAATAPLPNRDAEQAGAATPDDVRAQVIATLNEPEASDAWRTYHGADEPDPRGLYALLGSRRLLAPAWPIAYGGRGLTPHHQAAVVRGLVEAGVSETLHTLSVQIAGAFLLGAANRAQRASILPDLAAGRSFATVLYSEPDVGSDLAALTTSAARDPAGGWRVTGRKVYSVKTRCADFGLVAARTSVEASRYLGISLLCVPLNAAGVEVNTLASVADEQFTDVTLDGVWVSDAAVIGRVGHAWPLITEALALERTGVDYHAKATRWLALWREYVDSVHRGPDAGQRVQVARMLTNIEAADLFADRCLTQLATGRVDPVLAAMTKLWCADTAREVAWWCTEEAGPDALWKAANDTGRIESAYREAPGLTISAGTAEMMLEVVAGSGLPSPGGDLAGFDEEPLAREVRAAARAIATVFDERDETDAWWGELARTDAFALDVPVVDGGLGLGLAASTIVCEELGRGLLDGGVLDTFAAVDAYVADPHRPIGRLAAAMAGDYRAAVVYGQGLPSGRVTPMLWPERVDEILVLTPTVVAHPAVAGRAIPSCSDTPLRLPSPPSGPGQPLHVDAARIVERADVRRAAWLVGLATGALGETARRVRDRRQFGRPLIEHQAIAFTLARLAARVSAVHLLVSAAANRADRRRCVELEMAHQAESEVLRSADVEPRPANADASGRPRAAAATLASACELAYAVTRESMQLCGAWGMTDEAAAQRFYRAAMVTCGLLGPTRHLWREADRHSPKGAEHVR